MSSTGLSIRQLLEGSHWFAQLTPRARDQVLADVVEQSVAAGDALIRHGQTALWWTGMLEGVMKWCTGTSDGRAVTLGGLTVGSWFGEGSLLREKPVEADIVALRFSRVALLPKETFEWLHATEPSFGRFLLQQINERLHWFMGDFVAHRVLGVEAQLARALVGLLHPWLHPGGDRHLQISQEELANLVGLSRQRCNQALSQFKARSLVRTEYGGVTLLDVDALRALSVLP
ncbi:Crp/Fnr family transcriptional regulator [Variovorax ginsengisoli]|uniref:CRP-like cAMP-binding protein n=1 Tax=Variovorax ginsengisoli TaxID=363844 RepID=A0ABT9S8W3_9BURK|nr:Crp/Fnr family transcriptional regulator [Variovorax ginsengisoli]MDP9900793.1 CRP-like cAMP-binding protein [Variovorax ginsengisoli]